MSEEKEHERSSAGNGDELDFNDPLTSKIMGAVRLHTHDHTMAYRITRDVLAVLAQPQGAGETHARSSAAPDYDVKFHENLLDQMEAAAAARRVATPNEPQGAGK